MIVVDASVVIKWIVVEPDSDIARELIYLAERFAAPSHLMVEVGRALLRKKRAGQVSAVGAKNALAGVTNSVDLVPVEDLSARAFDIADTAHVTIYDALYVALAERTQSRFVTADRRLVEGLRRTEWDPYPQLLIDRTA